MKLFFLSRLVRYLRRLYESRQIRESNETEMRQPHEKNEIGCTYSEVVK